MKQSHHILEIILAVSLLSFFKQTVAYADADGSTFPFRTRAVFNLRSDSSGRSVTPRPQNSSGAKTASVPARTDKPIVVEEAAGCGTTRQEALRDAMRKAIAHAVGSYVSTEFELKDDDMNERIVVSSNAVLSNYKELDSMEQDGVWMVKIQASVQPNEYLKYCPKLIAQDISAELQEIVGSVVGNENLEETLDEIFDFYPTKLFDFKKTAIKPGANTDLLNDDFVSIDIDYSASINKEAYEKFMKSIRDVVEKNAVFQTTHTQTYRENAKIGHQTHDILNEATLEGKIERASSTVRYSIVGFDSINRNKITTTYYLVRKELFNLLAERYTGSVFIVFSFAMADESEAFRAKNKFMLDFADRNTGVLPTYLFFKDINDIGLSKDSFGKKDRFPFKTTLSLEDIPTENVKEMKELTIYLLNASNMFDDQQKESYENRRTPGSRVFSVEAERIEREWLHKTADR